MRLLTTTAALADGLRRVSGLHCTLFTSTTCTAGLNRSTGSTATATQKAKPRQMLWRRCTGQSDDQIRESG